MSKIFAALQIIYWIVPIVCGDEQLTPVSAKAINGAKPKTRLENPINFFLHNL